MSETLETVIIGGGQAGLATSYYLMGNGQQTGFRQAGRWPHRVLEKAEQPGHVWGNRRWDSFTLVTPNWSFRLPGMAYEGSDPHGFMARDEVAAVFEQYVLRYNLPVRYGTTATAVWPRPGGGYLVQTANDTIQANNVVVATGLYQQAKVPAYSQQIPAHITQLTSDQYRNPHLLPPGGVLVVGTGQSGCQIAEELQQNGRSVYLSVGSTGRAPRHYRGKDVYEWLHLVGFLDRTPDKLPSPQARFASNPHVTGSQGGRTINLHLLARHGVTLLGHVQAVKLAADATARLILAADLHDSLAKADQFEQQIVTLVDGYIRQNGLDAPPETLPDWRDGYAAEPITELDLTAAGISTIIWAIGYTFDFSLVRLPVFDAFGYPVQQRGITEFPGLYFVGLPWLHKMKSGLLLGVGEDAATIAAHIAAQ